VTACRPEFPDVSRIRDNFVPSVSAPSSGYDLLVSRGFLITHNDAP
jgi:hypothetical protein